MIRTGIHECVQSTTQVNVSHGSIALTPACHACSVRICHPLCQNPSVSICAVQTPPQVAQLAGYVSEHSAYHHGEASLSSTIVGLAQNFVGSNNVNLLYPSGAFAQRTQWSVEDLTARDTHTAQA